MTTVLAAQCLQHPFYMAAAYRGGGKMESMDAAGSIVANYEVWCVKADTVEADVRSHVDSELSSKRDVISPASPPNDYRRQLSPIVMHYDGTSRYAVGGKNDTEVARIQVRVECGRGNEYYDEARACAVEVQRLIECMDGMTIGT